MNGTPEQPKRRGRPTPDDGGRDGRLNMRVHPDDKAAWQEHARQSQQTLSAWIVDTLNEAAAQVKGRSKS